MISRVEIWSDAKRYCRQYLKILIISMNPLKISFPLSSGQKDYFLINQRLVLNQNHSNTFKLVETIIT